MLIGEYNHTIDGKGRISLPAKFRKEMGKKLVVTYGLDHCLFVFTEKEWGKISNHLSEFSLLQSDNRSFNRFMFGGAIEASVDSIGRILLPDHLKGWGSLKQKAVIIGVQNRLEIWSDTAWKGYKKQIEKQADGLAEKLGGAGVL
jgi:MraZ protein